MIGVLHQSLRWRIHEIEVAQASDFNVQARQRYEHENIYRGAGVYQNR